GPTLKLDRSDRMSAPMTPPTRNPADPPRMTPAAIAPDRARAAVQLAMHNSVVEPLAPPMRAPLSRPMPAPTQKWPLVPAPLERRLTEVVGMTNAAVLDCPRMSALWATPRLGARSSGRTMAVSRCMRSLRGSPHLRVSICTGASGLQGRGAAGGRLLLRRQQLPERRVVAQRFEREIDVQSVGVRVPPGERVLQQRHGGVPLAQQRLNPRPPHGGPAEQIGPLHPREGLVHAQRLVAVPLTRGDRAQVPEIFHLVPRVAHYRDGRERVAPAGARVRGEALDAALRLGEP